MGAIPVALDLSTVTYSTTVVLVQRQQCTFSHSFVCPSAAGDSNTTKLPQTTSTPQHAESSDSGYSSAQESKLLLNEVPCEYPSTTKHALSCEYSTYIRTHLQAIPTGMNLSVYIDPFMIRLYNISTSYNVMWYFICIIGI